MPYGLVRDSTSAVRSRAHLSKYLPIGSKGCPWIRHHACSCLATPKRRPSITTRDRPPTAPGFGHATMNSLASLPGQPASRSIKTKLPAELLRTSRERSCVRGATSNTTWARRVPDSIRHATQSGSLGIVAQRDRQTQTREGAATRPESPALEFATLRTPSAAYGRRRVRQEF